VKEEGAEEETRNYNICIAPKGHPNGETIVSTSFFVQLSYQKEVTANHSRSSTLLKESKKHWN
jgi:hypothetical protein